MIVILAEEWRKRADGTMERVRVITEERPDAEVRAEHVATLREQAWSGVDMREALACLAVVVGQLAAKLPEAEREAMAPALAYCDRVTTLLAGWADLEAAVGAATTYEQVQAVRPPLPDLTPPRAADLARAVRGRQGD